MTPRKIRAQVVLERIAWVHQMLDAMRALPVRDFGGFIGDPRNVASTESYLRRALEALLDTGRHILAKGFGEGVLEYKGIAEGLGDKGVLSPECAAIFTEMAGYRNRLTHFYNEVAAEELYGIFTKRLRDIDRILDEILAWLRAHPELLDKSL